MCYSDGRTENDLNNQICCYFWLQCEEVGVVNIYLKRTFSFDVL